MKYQITPLWAIKRRAKDHYENGQTDDLGDIPLDVPAKSTDTIVQVMSGIVGRKLTKDDVYTFDPNVYQDTKQPPGYRVVENNSRDGQYRVEYDCLETDNGKVPSENTMALFKAGTITLIAATYEVHFTVQCVDMEGKELAEFLGCVNHG